MRVNTARSLLAPSQGYVCLSCRLQSAAVQTGRSRRYQHSSRPKKDEKSEEKGFQTLSEALNNDKGAKSSSSPTIREIIKGFIFNDSTKAEGRNGHANGGHVGLKAVTHQEDPPTNPEPANSDGQDTQKALQRKFAAARRKQMLQLQPDLPPKEPEIAHDKLGQPVSSGNPEPVSNPAKPLSKKASRQQMIQNRSAKRQKAKREREETNKTNKAAKRAQQVLDRRGGKKLSASALSKALPESKLHSSLAVSGLDEAHKDMPPDDHSDLGSLITDEGTLREVVSTVPEQLVRELGPASDNEKLTRRVLTTILRRLEYEAEKEIGKTSDNVPKGETTEGGSSSKATASAQKVTANRSVSEQARDAKPPAKEKRGGKRMSETARKVELASKLGMTIHKHPVDPNPLYAAQAALSANKKNIAHKKKEVLSRSKKSGTQMSDVAGFDSLQNALGGKGTKPKTPIEKADATHLEILPLEVDQPPVPSLSYGLERVLFNPGVYQLQDPRSRVFNFDPYLQKIMPVAEFDFNALKEYITSSRDESLNRIAKEYGKRYMGSTSSMTSALSHFHFLLSQWRPINTSMLSKEFPTNLSSFTELQRTPQAIFLRWKDGSYAIDADKQFANANVLSMLGKSMEKLLTLSTDDYERYRKSSGGEVTDEESLAPESYHYSTMGDFLMRSQLDAHDPRLPGTGMFDLKTRAVVSIRMDVSNYEHGLGYQIKSRQGQWESYEREYYDMIRAAFLKYSMQVRMGRMDGIFVAFHNIERIFGFQYISLPEMDSTIHGQWDTSIGDQEFKLSLDLLNKILDKATKKYPETSLRIHFETRDAATPFMYIFAEPVTEEQVAEIQSQNDAKIQEFERNILGLKSGEESEPDDDDGKWENIQASVQEAMDKDELSVDDSSGDQECQEGEMEGETLHSRQGVLEEGPLYANRDRVVAEERTNLVTALDEDDEVQEEEEGEEEAENEDVKEGADQRHLRDEGQEDDAETEDVTEKADQEQLKDEEEGENMDEHNKDDVEAKEDGVLVDDKEPDDRKEAIEAESAILQDPADKCQVSDERGLEQSERSVEVEPSAESQHDGGKDARSSEQPPELGVTQEGQSPPAASNKGAHKAEKAEYTPPVPGDEPPETKFQTEADRSFLDAIHEETAHLETLTSESSDVLAMTLTVRNKVNDQFVLRPEKLTADDVWSIEYSLVEVPKQERARALYEACQARRKKKLDAPMVPEDAEVISHYLMNLRKLSTRGRQWREEMDEKDSKSPVQVLGKDIVTNDGEMAPSDQYLEA